MAALIAAVLAILFVPTHDGTSIILKAFVAIVFLLATIYLGWMWWGSYYLIDDDTLLIVFGPHKFEIPLNEIISIRYTKSILASTTLSFAKYEITYNDPNSKIAMVSPRDRTIFLYYMNKKKPNIKLINVETF